MQVPTAHTYPLRPGHKIYIHMIYIMHNRRAIIAVISQSLQTGVFPSVFKEAIVKPLPKKPSLDPNSLKNYRPISNLYFL